MSKFLPRVLSRLVLMVLLFMAVGYLPEPTAAFQSCTLRTQGYLGGCTSVNVLWFTQTPQSQISHFNLNTFQGGFTTPNTARSFSIPTSCSSGGQVIIQEVRTNGTICSAQYSGNLPHNRPCDQCAAISGPISVVNAANFRSSTTADSIAVIFGDGLATETVSANSFPLPTSLAGVQVFFDGQQCELFFVSPKQVNFRIPFSAVAGLRTVRVTNREGKSFFGDVYIQSQAPGIFTRDATGGGAAAAAYLVFGAQTYAVLFATGINPDLIGATDVSIQTVTGRFPASWVGRAPGFAGLVQINVPIPASQLDGRGATLNVAVWQSQGFILQR
jgi:uncharacterized protein (TIGR03437 family)